MQRTQYHPNEVRISSLHSNDFTAATPQYHSTLRSYHYVVGIKKTASFEAVLYDFEAFYTVFTFLQI